MNLYPVRKPKRIDQFWPLIDKHVQDGLELRRPHESQWIINLAFLTGNQYAYFNSLSHTLLYKQPHPGQIRAVDNILLPKWKRQVSDLIKSRPEIAVVPNSNQEEDIAAAKVGTKIAQWYYNTNLLKDKIQKIAAWQFSCGNAFLSDSWNKKKGDFGLDRETGKLLYEGDVDSDVWSPFEILLPAAYGDDDLQRLPWIAKRKRKSLVWIVENFKRGNEVVAEEISENSVTFEQLVSGYTSSNSSFLTPSAYVVELYVKPCSEFPRGAFFIAANKVVLEKADWPYNEFPMEHFKDIDVPGILWGEATITHAIPLQRSWNRNLSSLETFNQNVAVAKLLTPRRSQVEALPDDTHGQQILYTPVLGYKPEYMDLKSLPPTIDKSMDQIQFSLENLFSQHEVSRGTNRSDIRSGDMVELLLEQDAHGAIPSHMIFERSLERHLSRVLGRIQAEYKNERIIKIGNSSDDFEAVAFKGADLRNHRDVKIVKTSSLPDSPALRDQKVERRFGQGLYGDPRDPNVARRVLRMMEDHVVDDIYSGTKQDEKLADWENRQMLNGQQMQVNEYDNHSIHIEAIDRLRKSIRYQKHKLKNAEVFTRIDTFLSLHRQGHVKFANEEMKKQMQLMGGLQDEKGKQS